MGSSSKSILKDRVFILRSIPYGDHHRILSCLTAEHGRVDLMAYAAQKSRQRFSGILDFLNLLELEWKVGRGNQLGQLVQADLAHAFPKLRQDYVRLSIALQWLKILAKSLPVGVLIHGIFPDLEHHFNILQENDAVWTDLIFQRVLLARLGYHLELAQCVICEKKEASCFRVSYGGMLCKNCSQNIQGIEVEGIFESSFWSEDIQISNFKKQRVGEVQRIFKEAFREFLSLNIDYF